MKPLRVVVAGGGITGLAAAYRLLKLANEAQAPLRLDLLETSHRLGGTIQTVHREGFTLEMGPDCFLSEKRAAVDLCSELGIADQLLSTQDAYRRSFILKGKKLYPVPEGFYLLGPSKVMPFLRSPILSVAGKMRVMAEPFLPRRRLGDESLASFVNRRLGREVLERLAQPLLAGIYAADPEQLSLRATFPRFVDLERDHGSVVLGLRRSMHRAAAAMSDGIANASGARYSLFVTLRRGMQSLIDRLAQALPEESIHRGTTVRQLGYVPATSQWQVRTDQGLIEADAVLLALPAYAAADVLGALEPEIGRILSGIPYASAATLNLAWRGDDIEHPLDGFGYVSPAIERRAAMACTFTHRKFAGRAPEGYALLRAFIGGAVQQDVLALSDAELVDRAVKDLSELLGMKGKPLFSWLQRWGRAMPQYPVGHLEKMEQLDSALKHFRGLALAGNWQKGVGVPDCVEAGSRAADRLWFGRAEG